MLAMGYTTSEAMRVKEAYIAKFNEMGKTKAPATLTVPGLSAIS